MATVRATLDDVRALMARTTGDEKHEESTPRRWTRCGCSTTGSFAIDPARPKAEDRDRFILSKGHGPAALLRGPRREGLLPRGLAGRFLEHGGPARRASRPARRCPASRRRPARSATGSRSAVGSRSRCAPRGSTEQRSLVLCGDAELNEGSNWESILLAPHARPRQPDPARDRQPQLVDRRWGRGRSGSARSAGTSTSWTDTTTTRSTRALACARPDGRTPIVADIPEGEW